MKIISSASTLIAVFAFIGSGATAQPIASNFEQTQLNVEVVPYAELVFPNGTLLYLEVPPGASTIPGGGVQFYVIGNAMASLSAEPDAFLEIAAPNGLPGISGAPGPYFLGRAESSGGDYIGYDIALQFPTPATSDARWPKSTAGPTPALSANPGNGNAWGIIDLITNAEWSNQGQLPKPGQYDGEVILTLTAY